MVCNIIIGVRPYNFAKVNVIRRLLKFLDLYILKIKTVAMSCQNMGIVPTMFWQIH